MKNLFEELGFLELLVLDLTADDWKDMSILYQKTQELMSREFGISHFCMNLTGRDLNLNEYFTAKPMLENFKAQLGATPPKAHTTVMHRLVTRC